LTTIGSNRWSRLALCLLAIPVTGLSFQESRIAGPIDGGHAVALKGHLKARAMAAKDRGALDP
jgi:hypothetical protein